MNNSSITSQNYNYWDDKANKNNVDESVISNANFNLLQIANLIDGYKLIFNNTTGEILQDYDGVTRKAIGGLKTISSGLVKVLGYTSNPFQWNKDICYLTNFVNFVVNNCNRFNKKTIHDAQEGLQKLASQYYKQPGKSENADLVFNAINKLILAEATSAAKEDGEALSKNIQNYHIQEPKNLFNIAQLALCQNLQGTLNNIDNFGFQDNQYYIDLFNLGFERDPIMTSSCLLSLMIKPDLKNKDNIIESIKIAYKLKLNSTETDWTKIPRNIIDLAELRDTPLLVNCLLNIKSNQNTQNNVLKILELAILENVEEVANNIKSIKDVYKFNDQQMIDLVKIAIINQPIQTLKNIQKFEINNKDLIDLVNLLKNIPLDAIFDLRLDNSDHVTLKFQCQGKINSVQCQKSILSARSDYFKTIFNSDKWAESQSDTMVLNVEDPDMAYEFIRCLYSGQATINEYNFQILLELSSRFGVDFIHQSCEEWLLDNLDDDQALEILDLAVTYHCQKVINVLFSSLLKKLIIEEGDALYFKRMKYDFKRMDHDSKRMIYDIKRMHYDLDALDFHLANEQLDEESLNNAPKEFIEMAPFEYKPLDLIKKYGKYITECNLSEIEEAVEIPVDEDGIGGKTTISLIDNDLVFLVTENCPNLTSLNLFECTRLEDIALINIAEKCKKLTSINIASCNFSDESIITLTEKSQNLSILKLNNNCTPSLIANIAENLKKLEEICFLLDYQHHKEKENCNKLLLEKCTKLKSINGLPQKKEIA